MVKAMYSGVAGLKAHQSKMDVIGNNIANVNTWGYKSMDTSFKESIYSMVNSGSAGSTANGGYGGTNPSAVGYGSMVSAISANFTSGNQVPTGKALDIYIDGTAFFAVGPMFGEGEAKAPGEVFLSRVGDFGIVNGYLVDSNGRYVYGSTLNQGGELYNPIPITTSKEVDVPLVLPEGASRLSGKNAKFTQYYVDPLNASKMTSYEFNGLIADEDLLKEFPDILKWLQDNPSANYPADNPMMPDGITPTPSGQLKFDDLDATELKAAVAAYNKAQGAPSLATDTRYVVSKDGTKIIPVEYDTASKKENQDIPLSPTDSQGKDENGVITTITFKASTDPGMQIRITTEVIPPDPDAVSEGPAFDDGRFIFDPVTGSYKMGESISTLKPLKIPTTCTYYENGEPIVEEDVEFKSYSITQDGMIWGTSAKTSKTYLIGCVGLVNVSNPSGMTKADGPYYQLGGSSGEGSIVQPGGTTGKLTSGYLESANVDIATEFSGMITTQRGFQANSKIITVTDEMLQELVNMKR